MLIVNTLSECAKEEENCPVAIRGGETPVPIPNTTVKTSAAEDTEARGFGKTGGCRAILFLKRSGLRGRSGANPERPVVRRLTVHIEN